MSLVVRTVTDPRGTAWIVGVNCDRTACTARHEAVNGPKNGVNARNEAEELGWLIGGFSGKDYCPEHPPTLEDLGLGAST